MKKALATLAILSVVAIGAQAQTTAYSTDFNAPTYTDGALLGQDGWVITGTSVVNPLTVSNTATNGVVTLAATGQDANRPFTPSFTSASANSFTLSADINLTSANATGDYFLHVSDGGTSNFFDRVYARQGSVGGTFDLGLATSGGGTIVYGADLNFGTTYSISALYNFVAGATNDTAQLLVNGNPYVAGVTTGTDASTISAINLRQGTTGPVGTVDNISLTFTPAAVPEPATWMLMGVGLLVGVTKRFRRKS